MMKLKRYFTSIYLLCGFGLIGWLAFMRPDWLLMSGSFTAIIGYLLIFIALTPAGNLVLGQSKPSLSLTRWLVQVLQAQLILGGITLAAVVVFFGGGPYFAEMVKINFVMALETVEDYSRWQWGIFPWGAYGLWAIIIAYVCYVKKGLPYIYQIAQGLWPKRLEPWIKTFAEATCNGATTIALSVLVTTIILLVSYLLEMMLKISHFKAPFITVMILSCFAPFIYLQINKSQFRQLFLSKMNLNHLYLILILILVPLLIMAAFANQWFVTHQAAVYQKMVCKQCGNYFANIPLESRFAAAYWGWWLIWTPLAGSYLAFISQGRTLRQFLVGLYLVPFILWVVAQIWGGAPFQWGFGYLKKLTTIELLSILTLFTLLVLFKITQGWKNSQPFITGMMPTLSTKRSRLWLKDGSKVVGLTKYIPRLYMAVIGTLFLHTTAGWYGLQFQLAAMAFLVINTLYMSAGFLVLQFFRDKVWLKKRTIYLVENKSL